MAELRGGFDRVTDVRRRAVRLAGMGGALASVILTLGAEGCPASNRRVGTGTCLACHDGFLAPDQSAFPDSAHFLNEVDCEDCHGPGFLHVRAGGRNGVFIDSLEKLPVTEAHLVCAECHESPTDGFLVSGHFELGAATCVDCHEVHVPGGLRLPEDDNSLCMQCHEFLEFTSEAIIDFHTGPMHPVDPLGTGASRCARCHMPPLEQRPNREGPRSHTLRIVPPISTVEAAEAGVFPVPPNSCAGVMSCHDPAFPDMGPPRDVNDLDLMRSLQPILEELIGGLP